MPLSCHSYKRHAVKQGSILLMCFFFLYAAKDWKRSWKTWPIVTVVKRSINIIECVMLQDSLNNNFLVIWYVPQSRPFPNSGAGVWMGWIIFLSLNKPFKCKWSAHSSILHACGQIIQSSIDAWKHDESCSQMWCFFTDKEVKRFSHNQTPSGFISCKLLHAKRCKSNTKHTRLVSVHSSAKARMSNYNIIDT